MKLVTVRLTMKFTYNKDTFVFSNGLNSLNKICAHRLPTNKEETIPWIAINTKNLVQTIKFCNPRFN